jgi:hypothetical protein
LLSYSGLEPEVKPLRSYGLRRELRSRREIIASDFARKWVNVPRMKPPLPERRTIHLADLEKELPHLPAAHLKEIRATVKMDGFLESKVVHNGKILRILP